MTDKEKAEREAMIDEIYMKNEVTPLTCMIGIKALLLMVQDNDHENITAMQEQLIGEAIERGDLKLP